MLLEKKMQYTKSVQDPAIMFNGKERKAIQNDIHDGILLLQNRGSDVASTIDGFFSADAVSCCCVMVAVVMLLFAIQDWSFCILSTIVPGSKKDSELRILVKIHNGLGCV